jgi:lipooligosaccharide transport system ATP-binding protein
MDVVTAKGLVKDYGAVRAVDGISFEIHRGESFGFLGPNGAGKTTVMRIIYCYLPPTAGTVTVLGMDVMKEPSAIKAQEGVMPQDDNLDPDLSSLENLMVYARYFDIPKSVSERRAWQLLEFVGLSEKAHVNIQKLSGGMKRLLILARSLVNDPEFLILDEPTTGMDPRNRQTVWKNLTRLKEQGTTLLLSTHYMEEARSLCDRVAIMDRGKIVAADRPERLMELHGGDLEEVYLKLTGRRLAA